MMLLVMSQDEKGVPVLKNPRDQAGRVLCPVCNAPITDTRIVQAGRFAYHRECWRPTEYPAKSN